MSNNSNELLRECLFGKVRRKVLSTFVLDPGRSFYLLELIRFLNCGRGAVQREVSRLAEAGIVTRTMVGNQVHYTTNTNNLIYKELKSIFSKTTGLVELLGADLQNCTDKLGMAFIYGDYANGTGVENSTGDLLVTGDTTIDAIRWHTEAFSTEAVRNSSFSIGIKKKAAFK